MTLALTGILQRERSGVEIMSDFYSIRERLPVEHKERDQGLVSVSMIKFVKCCPFSSRSMAC